MRHRAPFVRERLVRMFAAAVLAVPLAVSAGLAAEATRAGHPHFNDAGALAWSTKLADAQAMAKASDRLIFIEYGRKACGNCKAVCESVLPDAQVKARLDKLCVGLAAECDPPGQDAEVAALLRANLKGASTLPFCGFVTHDLKWVAGFAGYKDVSGFVAVLDEAEKSPLLNASPETTKKLDLLATAAAGAAEKQQWAKVFAAARDAAKLSGRAPSRDKLAEAVDAARKHAESELARAAQANAAADRPAARAALKKLVSAFAGEREAAEAEAGVKALDRLGVIEGLPAEKQAAAREKAAKDLEGSRWAALFAAPSGAPQEKPAGEPQPAK